MKHKFNIYCFEHAYYMMLLLLSFSVGLVAVGEMYTSLGYSQCIGNY